MVNTVYSIKEHIILEPLPEDARELQDERRLAVRLYRYWASLRKGRRFCAEDDINPEAIPDLWPYCFLIQVNDLKNRHRADFTYLGREILRLYNESLSSEDAKDLVSPNISHLSQNFWLVIERKAPIMQSGSFPTSKGNSIKFRQCLLPLGKTDAEVEAIFGCVNLKLYL